MFYLLRLFESKFYFVLKVLLSIALVFYAMLNMISSIVLDFGAELASEF